MLRDAFFALYPTVVLGLTLPFAVAGYAPRSGPVFDLPGCAGHTQADDPAAVCYDHEAGAAREDIRAAREPYDVLVAGAGHECAPAARWQLPPLRGRVPTFAVVKTLDGRVVGLPFDAAWELATAGQAWTLQLCEELDS